MAIYGRHSVLTGESLDLKVIFRDDANCLVDADALPDIYIYDATVDRETVDAELEAMTFTSAIAGSPFTPTLLSTGFYELVFAVPSGAAEGTWHDVWVAAVDGAASNEIFEFQVDIAADLSLQELLDNELIIICLDSTIANTAGDLTLGTDQQLSFSTTYNPLYASPDLVRMEIGTFIDYIPDDTLALMIHWSSKEADFIRRPTVCNNADYEYARTKFVIFDAALRALTMPGGASGSGAGTISEGTKKALGDLMIDKSGGGGPNTIAVTSGGVDIETLRYIRDMRDEWWRVVNAGGCIVPGQSLDPETAIKGKFDPDRRASGRLWANPEFSVYSQPGANSKFRFRGHQRGKFGFDDHRRILTRRRFAHRRRF